MLLPNPNQLVGNIIYFFVTCFSPLFISPFCPSLHSIQHLIINSIDLSLLPISPSVYLSHLSIFLPSALLYLLSTFLICKFLSLFCRSLFYPSFSSVHLSLLTAFLFCPYLFSVFYIFCLSLLISLFCPSFSSDHCSFLFISPLCLSFFLSICPLCLCLHSIHLFPLFFSTHSSSLLSVDFSYCNLTDLWFEI